MISGSRRPTLGQRMVLYGILAALVLLATFPFYWMLLTSLKTGRAVFDTTQVLLARNLTLQNYMDLFRTTGILRWVWITAALAAASTVIALIISILAAYSITDFRYRGRKFISFAVFLSYVIPQAMLFIPLFLLLNRCTPGQHVPGTGAGLPDFLRAVLHLAAPGLFPYAAQRTEGCRAD